MIEIEIGPRLLAAILVVPLALGWWSYRVRGRR